MAHANSSATVMDVRTLPGGAGGVLRGAAVVGLLGVAVGVVFGALDGWTVFFRSYLLNFSFVLSLALGALFFVMLQHLTRAGWSVSVRRLAELIMNTMPVLAVLAIPLAVPVLLHMEGVYEWANAEHVSKDALLQHKATYLNAPFFIIRMIVYFAAFVLLARFFFRTSVAQDQSGDVALTRKMERVSAWGMLVYAMTVTFFSFDALMSLNPHWFSTIFGVYYFSGSVVAFFALLAVVVYWVQRAGLLTRSITTEHYHDIGKLAFGFVVFWAYIAFSQYLLIWYANIPEETVWYRPRQGDTWWIGVSLVLLFGHFVAPFLLFMSRYPKRRVGTLMLFGLWLLAMHWLDLYYLVMPRPMGAESPTSPLHVSDFALLVGLGGLFVCAMVRPMGRVSLLPERDPRLHEALSFTNV